MENIVIKRNNNKVIFLKKTALEKIFKDSTHYEILGGATIEYTTICVVDDLYFIEYVSSEIQVLCLKKLENVLDMVLTPRNINNFTTLWYTYLKLHSKI